MTEYKKGDRVEVIAAEGQGDDYGNGEILTITDPAAAINGGLIYAITNDENDVLVYSREIRLTTPAPSLITIDRADLPEVEDNGHGWLTIKGSGKTMCSTRVGAETIIKNLRRNALESLSTIEFLEARERQAAEDAAAEKLGEQVMQKRRDELAKEIAEKAEFPYPELAEYNDMPGSARAAIDRIIELEDAASAD